MSLASTDQKKIANPQTTVSRSRMLLREAQDILLRAAIESARLDAELLLAKAMGIERTELLAGRLQPDKAAEQAFRQMISRRASSEPLAYIVGHKEFYSLDLEVNPEVLIPRPETELLVETALKSLGQKADAKVLDLCTGSGAIAIALAVHRPDVQLLATDISRAALEVANRNARRLGVSDRIVLSWGDCWEAIEHPVRNRTGRSGFEIALFDLIVSNPPYIASGAIPELPREVMCFEPLTALAGGSDGLEFYRRIAAGVYSRLVADGEVMVEVGAGQADAVAEIFSQAGCEPVAVIADLSGHQRVVHAVRRGTPEA